MSIIYVGTLFKIEKFELRQNIANVDKNWLRDSDDSNQTQVLQMLTVQEYLLHTLVSQLPAPV